MRCARRVLGWLLTAAEVVVDLRIGDAAVRVFAVLELCLVLQRWLWLEANCGKAMLLVELHEAVPLSEKPPPPLATATPRLLLCPCV